MIAGDPETVLDKPGAAILDALPFPQLKIRVVGFYEFHAVFYHRGVGDLTLLGSQPGPFAVLFLPVQVPGGQLPQLELDALGLGLNFGLASFACFQTAAS
ncbi:MAG TPA: hypothetical protein VGD91_06480, partial [Trebonia sp.]